MNYKKTVLSLLEGSNIEIGKDLEVKNENFYKNVILGGSLELGESYMRGDWESNDLSVFFKKIFCSNIEKKIKKNYKELVRILFSRIMNFQSRGRAFEVGEEHYDLGNDLYESMLDKRLTYTCGYWRGGASNLDEAQEHKLDLVCKKLGLEKGMKVLDIGCGWGSFMGFAAERYGVECTGLTVSKEQVQLGKQLYKDLPIQFLLEDYRDHQGQYDRIVSIGMLEAVGPKNFETYMKIAHENLKKDGVFVLHTITKNLSNNHIDPWIDKYIFPNGVVPSISQITKSAEEFFVLEDLHNFGEDYAKTLRTWNENFNKSYESLKEKNPKYNERFKRMWNYYLSSCEGGFLSRVLQLWQIVMTKAQDHRTQPNCRLS